MLAEKGSSNICGGCRWQGCHYRIPSGRRWRREVKSFTGGRRINMLSFFLPGFLLPPCVLVAQQKSVLTICHYFYFQSTESFHRVHCPLLWWREFSIFFPLWSRLFFYHSASACCDKSNVMSGHWCLQFLMSPETSGVPGAQGAKPLSTSHTVECVHSILLWQ